MKTVWVRFALKIFSVDGRLVLSKSACNLSAAYWEGLCLGTRLALVEQLKLTSQH